MSKVKYIAVTLGPIFKTIGLAESTGALWAASYMFSYLSKSICEYLLEHSEFNISEEDIIVPYYHKNAAGTKEDSAAADVIVSDGVGRFPDHIIFRAKNFDVTDFSALRASVTRSLADALNLKDKEDYLCRYLLIACAAFDVDEEKGENPILKSGLVLDSLELFQPIIRFESCNEIVKAVSNHSIRELPLTQGFKNWPLLSEDRKSIRSIEDIVDTSKDGKACKQLKKHDYYAVVRSDADAVSKIIASLKADELRNFSRTCVLYCGEMADLVHRYSGVTIYSGGDDLLALLPAESSSGETVFHFARDAKDLFQKSFKTYIDAIKAANAEKKPGEEPIPVPSLSLGISICYSKFPLYEALDDSADLLFDYAKNRCGKNCVAVRLQKHSGQSECLVLKGIDGLTAFTSFLDDMPKSFDEGLLHSVIYAFCSFAPLFIGFNKLAAAADFETVRVLFRNMFDSSVHVDGKYSDYLYKTLPAFYSRLTANADIRVFEEAEHSADKTPDAAANAVRAMEFVLRIAKFYIEKGGKEIEQDLSC